ncbi:MAG: RNA polymerase sigma factor [Bacteroidia bacterium]|nr:RNA polymerase sigma factor [Bacteroidia bacterium]
MLDPSIINEVKKRKHDAFKELYERCIRYVYSIVNRYVSNESDHQDVIQEIFARVYLSIGSFDEKKGEFKFWLRRLTINQCIQHYRKQNSSVKIVPLDSAASLESDPNEIAGMLSKDEIESYLKRMPEGYKQIFMLVIIDEYSHQEVSEMLNISPETSRSQLHRAKKWLRANLSVNNLKSLVGEI